MAAIYEGGVNADRYDIEETTSTTGSTSPDSLSETCSECSGDDVNFTSDRRDHSDRDHDAVEKSNRAKSNQNGQPLSDADSRSRLIIAAEVALSTNASETSKLTAAMNSFRGEGIQCRKFRKQCVQFQQALDASLRQMADANVLHGVLEQQIAELNEYVLKLREKVHKIFNLSNQAKVLEARTKKLETMMGALANLQRKMELKKGIPYDVEDTNTNTICFNKVSQIVTSRGGTDDVFEEDHDDSDQDETSCSQQSIDDDGSPGATYKCAWIYPPLKGSTDPVPCNATFKTLAELKKHKKMVYVSSGGKHFAYNVNIKGPCVGEKNCGFHLIRPLRAHEDIICQGLRNGGKDNNARKRHLVDKPHTIDYVLLNNYCHICEVNFDNQTDFVDHLRGKKNFKCVTAFKDFDGTLEDMRSEEVQAGKCSSDRATEVEALVDELTVAALGVENTTETRFQQLKKQLMVTIQTFEY